MSPTMARQMRRRSCAIRQDRAGATVRCGLGAAIAITVLASGCATSAAGEARSANPASRPGFLLTSGPTLPHLRAGAFVIDSHGRDHVVGSQLSGGGTSSRRHNLTYLTRQAGSQHWVDKVVPGHVRIGGAAHLALLRRNHGTEIVAVVAVCARDAVYTVEAPAKATRLPPPALALSTDMYNCDRFGPSVKFTAAAVAPRDRLALLFDSPDASGSPLVTIGAPGQSFPAPASLPDPDGIGISAVGIARNPQSGQLFVVGNGPDGVYVWTRPRDGIWSEPERIVQHDQNTGYFASSIDANGKVVVGLFGTATYRWDLAIVTRRATGAWSAPETLPHVRTPDLVFLVRLDAVHQRLHAVFDHRSDTKTNHDGVRQMVFANGTWSHQHRMTGRGDDTPLDVELTPDGHAVASYRYLPVR